MTAMSDDEIRNMIEWLEGMEPTTTPFFVRRGNEQNRIIADGVAFSSESHGKVVISTRGVRPSTTVWDGFRTAYADSSRDGTTDFDVVPVSALIKAVLAVLKLDPEAKSGDDVQHGLGWAEAINTVHEAVCDAIAELDPLEQQMESLRDEC